MMARLHLAFSLTGSVIEQFERFAPEVLDRFRELAETGCVEFLAETYHHSLASLYSRDEFLYQLDLHANLIEDLFGQSPHIFRNTELIYSNDLADLLAETRQYRGIIAEGVDQLLNKRSPNHLYSAAHHPDLTLLLKNYRLSDDIAFRFSDPKWKHHPLTAATFADWVHRSGGEVCNLFMDFETFGEHQWEDTGIFEFLEALPREILAQGDEFLTPSEAIDAYEPVDVYDVPTCHFLGRHRARPFRMGRATPCRPVPCKSCSSLKPMSKTVATINSSPTGANSPPATISITCAPSISPTATYTNISTRTNRPTTVTSTT